MPKSKKLFIEKYVVKCEVVGKAINVLCTQKNYVIR